MIIVFGYVFKQRPYLLKMCADVFTLGVASKEPGRSEGKSGWR